MQRLWIRIYWPFLRALDRWRLRRLMRLHPGLEIHPDASTNFAFARFELAEGARLRIGPNVFTERRRDAVCFRVDANAEINIGAGTWLYTDLGTMYLRAMEGGRLMIAPDCWLHACHISAKELVELSHKAWVGPGSRVLDSDQHDLDADQPQRTEPIRLGEHTWISADVTIMRGVEIGDHSVIGARSLVTRSIPPHSLAFGNPATVRGKVGDRSKIG